MKSPKSDEKPQKHACNKLSTATVNQHHLLFSRAKRASSLIIFLFLFHFREFQLLSSLSYPLSCSPFMFVAGGSRSRAAEEKKAGRPGSQSRQRRSRLENGLGPEKGTAAGPGFLVAAI